MRQNTKPLEEARRQQKRFQGAAVQIAAIMRFVDERIAEGITDEHDLANQALDWYGKSASNRQHDALPASVTADEKRLKIVARELLRGHGLRTISYLHELAAIAKNAGDQSSAEAWQELADAAERIIQILSRGE